MSLIIIKCEPWKNSNAIEKDCCRLGSLCVLSFVTWLLWDARKCVSMWFAFYTVDVWVEFVAGSVLGFWLHHLWQAQSGRDRGGLLFLWCRGARVVLLELFVVW